ALDGRGRHHWDEQPGAAEFGDRAQVVGQFPRLGRGEPGSDDRIGLPVVAGERGVSKGAVMIHRGHPRRTRAAWGSSPIGSSRRLWQPGCMPAPDVVLLPICVAIALLGVILAGLAWRRGSKGRVLQWAAVAIVPFGLYLTGFLS